MKKNIVFLVTYFILCLALFLCVQKPLFMLYNWRDYTSVYSVSDIVNIYKYGFTLDLASSGYMTVIPFFAICFRMIFNISVRKFLVIYSLVISFVVALITVGDTVLYEFWNFKLDSTIFLYVDDPKNAVASVSAGYIAVRLILLLVVFIIYAMLLLQHVRLYNDDVPENFPHWFVSFSVLLCIAFCLVLFIRGIDSRAKSISLAVFSNKVYLNHAALNPVFNVIYTSTRVKDFKDEFNFFPKRECEEIFSPLFPTQGGHSDTLLTNERPDILFLVVESFGASFMKSLGGMDGVAPNMDRLSKEGILFTNCYCSSFRTDRAIVAVLSGYLGQPTTSIMRYPHKVGSLPGLPKTLKHYGYETMALYAGDMTFFNMADYLVASGHDRLVSKNDFKSKERISAWGVPDGIAFDWLLDEINKNQMEKKHWYTTFLTLSSHEPFDVPEYKRLADERYNAFAYTDSCIGRFIDRLRETPAWNNILIVCVADHSFNSTKSLASSATYHHVPLLLLGGAVKTNRRIDKFVSQTDIVATILGQMHIPHDEFIFSRDVMGDTYKYPFAFSTYNNGFMFRDSTGCTVYDNVAGKALSGENKSRERKGKAILQTLYYDLSRR